MSTIRKTPYIESAVALLSDEQKTALLLALNTATPVTTQANFKSFTEGINAVIFTLPNGVIKTGILINITGLELLIAYQTNEQTLELIALNSTNETFSRIDEYCDINELRRVIVDSTPSGTVVIANPALEAGEEYDDALFGLQVGDDKLGVNGVNVLTTAPTEDNEDFVDGYLRIVVLDSEPETKYDGYLYIITG